MKLCANKTIQNFHNKKNDQDWSFFYLFFTPGLSSYPAVKIADKKAKLTPNISNSFILTPP